MADGIGWLANGPSTMPSAISHQPCRKSFPLHPGNHFLTDVLRRRLVAIEVHRIGRAALRARSEIRGIAEHFRQRHAGGDDLRTATIFLRLNLAAPARQV